MNRRERRSRANRALAGYANGPGATRRTRDAALARVSGSRLVVLVEGISDLMALEAVAERQGRALDDEGVVVLPVGGAHGFERELEWLVGSGVEARVLVDESEQDALGSLGLSLDVHVCIRDLEDELIRAVTPARVESVLEREGDLGSFRTLQRQPAWREGDLTSQLRRFFGAGARRKLRYARLLALELEAGQVPAPLAGVLTV